MKTLCFYLMLDLIEYHLKQTVAYEFLSEGGRLKTPISHLCLENHFSFQHNKEESVFVEKFPNSSILSSFVDATKSFSLIHETEKDS